MSENVIQASFASGELSPSLFARVDVSKYHSGAATMRNFFVDYRSGASTRPGTEFIRPGGIGSPIIRLIRFQQSVDVTYVLEFGNQYLRFISNGGSVVEPAINIDSAVFGIQTLISLISVPSWANGNLIFISGSNVPQLNNRYFVVSNLDGNNMQIIDPMTVQAVNSSGWPAYTGSGVAQRIYTIPTPYTSSELALLKFSQKASQLNITHPDHKPHVLRLISATNWVLAQDVYGSSAAPPTGLAGAASATGPANYMYKVTSIDANGQESGPSAGLHFNNVIDMRVIDAATNTSGSISLSWNPVFGAIGYNVYASSPRINAGVVEDTMVGFVGTTTGVNFVDANTGPDFQTQPPVSQNPFVSINPQCSSYFQQRFVLANGGGNDRDRFWMSKPGTDFNFDIANPSQADDAIDARLVSLEVNEIKSMIPMPSGLIMLTTKGAWQVSGGAGGVATQGGPVTPISLTSTPQAYVGANDVPPILVNYDIIFVQQKGSVIRDLTYNIYANIYTGADISIMSSHLFYGHQIVEWAYAEEPFKILWCVREDGILLSLTLVKEQEMVGWARHDTLGNFRSVCTVTEGPVDATYFVVERPQITGSGSALIIERLAEREFTFGAEDAFSVDCGVRTTTTFPPPPLTVSAATGNVSLIVDFPWFQGGLEGWIIRCGGGIIKITQVLSNQNALGTVIQPITEIIPNDPQGRPDKFPPGTWTIDLPRTTIYGLSHLEGQKVSVLADGGVVNGLTVVDGSITLPGPATRIVAGYGYQAQLQTMYLDLGQEANTIQGKRKKISALTVRVKDSRGLKAGRAFDTVTPIKELNRVTVMGLPIPLITADERIIMDPLWDVPGQICLQVDDPLPVTVLGVIPEVTIGDTPK